jgi:phage terminase large subunit
MTIEINNVYKKANNTKSRYRVLFGGAGSGKSHFVAQEIILNMLSNKSYSYLCVRKTAKSIRNSVFRLLHSLIYNMGLITYFTFNKTEMSIQCVTGATLITSGLDNVERLKSIAGINRIWIEEASEITEADFNQLDLRLRGHSNVGHQITLTFNPISELHWIKKSFFDLGRNEAFILKSTYKDNRFLDDKYINTLLDLEKQDYQYYRIYVLGEWGSLGNVVYTNWIKEDLRDKIKYFDNIYNGLDWGFADDPTAFVRLHLDNKHKVIYIFDEIYERGMFIDDIVDKVNQVANNEIITCDSSEPRSIADAKRRGLKVKPAKKGAGSIEHGIKWLQGHKIIVDNSCVNIIKELSSYKWREDKDGNIMPKAVDKNNHGLDALRYALEDEMKQANKWGW